MVSNISFTSTYKVSNQNNGYDRFSSFQDLALEKESEKDVGVSFKDGFETGYQYGYGKYFAQYTLCVPDEMDSEIEQYCSYNNIKYTKYTNRELLDLNSIAKRIEEPKEGMPLVNVNTDKMKKLLFDQYSNMEHCKKDYKKYYKKSVDFMLKSGDTFPVSTISITPDSANIDDAVAYIKKYGIDLIEPGLLFVDFNQRTNDPDHCVYFALQDLGMKNIPVYMNANSYKIADALGILE